MIAPPGISAEVRDLAAKIYVSLVGQAPATEGPAQAAATAVRLARLSFELAEAFQQVQNQLNEANLPRNQHFQLDNASITAWTKPA